MDKGFVDIHCHTLSEIDDGARTTEEMYRMLDIAYDEGIRTICFTPHIRQPWLDRKPSKILESFVKASKYADTLSGNLTLYLGGELFYSGEILEEYPEKIVTLNETDVLLVEFLPDITFKEMVRCLKVLQEEGYVCMLAHTERYKVLYNDIKATSYLSDMGVYLQVNSGPIVKPRNLKVKKFVRKLLKNELVDVVSTDAHRADVRQPKMKAAYKLVSRKYGVKYADDIFRNNALKILEGEDL